MYAHVCLGNTGLRAKRNILQILAWKSFQLCSTWSGLCLPAGGIAFLLVSYTSGSQDPESKSREFSTEKGRPARTERERPGPGLWQMRKEKSQKTSRWRRDEDWLRACPWLQQEKFL
jgi:hypothetical protein